MSLLHSIKLLLNRSEANIQRNDVLLARQERLRQAIQGKIDAIDNEIHAIEELNLSLNPSGDFNREKLFALKRRQASLRRKIAEMKMMRSQHLVEQEKCIEEKNKILQIKQRLIKQSDKYSRLSVIERKKKYVMQARLEENEIEEQNSWR